MNNIKRIALLCLVILGIPMNGFLGDYRFETCFDDDAGGMNSFRISLDVNDRYYYACKIGYIDGEVNIGWKVTNTAGLPMTILILNNDNMKKFVSGDPYGFSNTALASLYGSVEDDVISSISQNAETNLVGDIYYLVINFGYRQTFDGESVNPDNRVDSFVDWVKNGMKELNEKDSEIDKMQCSIDLDYI